MRKLWLWIVGVVLVWPIHSTAAMVGTKPIELLLSDVLILFMPFVYLFAGSRPSKQELSCVKAPIRSSKLLPILALIFIVYATTLAAVGLGMTGEYIRVYSAFKMVKPVCFVFLGLILGSWTDPLELIGMMGRAYGVVVGLTMFCTVTDSSFPMGEWGKYIFEYDLSGYPNSAMSFYACLVPVLLAVADTSKERYLQIIGWGLAGCSALLILGSMSRSSTIALLIGVAIYMVLTGRTALLIAFVLAILVMSIIGFGLFSVLKETDFVAVLTERVQGRLERSTESEDPSSGRFEIWALAIELWVERPVFGYMFESFSKYANDIDTPHQQYLEVLYKCGGLGLFLYLTLLASCLMVALRLRKLSVNGSSAKYYLHAVAAMLIGLLVGNLTQPNLTFSLTGNLVFLVFGCLCSSRAVISASQTAGVPGKKIVRTVPKPIPQIAA